MRSKLYCKLVLLHILILCGEVLHHFILEIAYWCKIVPYKRSPGAFLHQKYWHLLHYVYSYLWSQHITNNILDRAHHSAVHVKYMYDLEA